MLSGDESVYVGLNASATLYGTALQVMDADDLRSKDRNPVDPDVGLLVVSSASPAPGACQGSILIQVLRSAIPVLNLVAFKLLTATAQPECGDQIKAIVGRVCRLCRSLHGRR